MHASRRLRLTLPQLERRLFTTLRAPHVRLRVGPLSAKARITMPLNPKTKQPREAIIAIDGAQDGYITATIHELIHFELYSMLLPWGALDEPIVLAVESAVYQHLEQHPRRLEQWRKAIHQKLEDT